MVSTLSAKSSSFVEDKQAVLVDARVVVRDAEVISDSTFLRGLPSLNELIVPDAVVVQSHALKDCLSKTVDLPLCVSIEQSGLAYSNVVVLHLHSLLILTDFALYGCRTLEELYMPMCTEIGHKACSRLEKLKDVELPRLRLAGHHGFAHCYSLGSFCAPVLSKAGASFLEYCHKLLHLELPSLTDVPISAFKGSYGVQSISLPVATTINIDAFRDCQKLQKIYSPLVTIIRSNACFGCTSLQAITAPLIQHIGRRAFGGVSLPKFNGAHVHTMGKEAFAGALTLFEVSFGPSLSQFPMNCFKDCLCLTTVRAEAVSIISERTFCNCIGLTDYAVPDSCRYIAHNAFEESGVDGLLVNTKTVMRTTFETTFDSLTVLLHQYPYRYVPKKLTTAQQRFMWTMYCIGCRFQVNNDVMSHILAFVSYADMLCTDTPVTFLV